MRPHFDERALHGAERVQLPADPDRLAELAPENHTADLAAALVRVGLDREIADQVLATT